MSKRNQKIENHLGLVNKIARRIFKSLPAKHQLDDIVSIGTEGLIRAVDSHCETYEGSFKKYACIKIEGSIKDYLRREDSLSRSSRSLANKLEKTRNTLSIVYSRAPTSEEVGDFLQIEISEYHNQRLSALAGESKSLDEECLECVSFHANCAELAFIENSYVDYIFKKHLSHIQTQVLKHHVFHDMTLKQIGLELGLSESRVCQIKAKAIKKLENVLAEAA